MESDLHFDRRAQSKGVRLGIKDVIIERNQRFIRKDQKEILERLCEKEALLKVRDNVALVIHNVLYRRVTVFCLAMPLYRLEYLPSHVLVFSVPCQSIKIE